MRLDILENGHSRMQKVVFRIIEKVVGGGVPGPIRVMSYRRKLCGKVMAVCFHEGMRGGTEWSVGEIELFAAFVSRLNQCTY